MPVIEGDPFGDLKDEKGLVGPEPREVNQFHNRSDCDSSTQAQHHTLGIKHNQASPGDHVHDGIGSRKIGQGLSLTVNVGTTTAADLTALIAMLHSVIEFTET